MVAEFPIDYGAGVRAVTSATLWEQLELAAFLQAHWSDNQVSCTIAFDPAREADDLPRALDLYQWRLKGVSFLPRWPMGAYKQMPYEGIDAEAYHQLLSSIRTDTDNSNTNTATNTDTANTDAINSNNEWDVREDDCQPEHYCTTDACEVRDHLRNK